MLLHIVRIDFDPFAGPVRRRKRDFIEHSFHHGLQSTGPDILDAGIHRDGNVRKDERGKTLYTTVIEFTSKEVREAFSSRVIEALLEFAPAAFETEDVA